MKRRDLMKKLDREAARRGLRLVVTEGGSHTKVSMGEHRTVVPRHGEINELTARAILKQMGVEQ